MRFIRQSKTEGAWKSDTELCSKKGCITKSCPTLRKAVYEYFEVTFETLAAEADAAPAEDEEAPAKTHVVQFGVTLGATTDKEKSLDAEKSTSAAFWKGYIPDGKRVTFGAMISPHGDVLVWKAGKVQPAESEIEIPGPSEALALLKPKLEAGDDLFVAAVTPEGTAMSVSFNLGHTEFECADKLMVQRLGAEDAATVMSESRLAPRNKWHRTGPVMGSNGGEPQYEHFALRILEETNRIAASPCAMLGGAAKKSGGGGGGSEKVCESSHPYQNNENLRKEVRFDGAMSITVTFDPQTDMETNCDRLRFFGEKEHYDNDSELLFNFTGRFSSGWSRGKIDAPKMVDGVMTWECEADHFAYRFYSDGSSTSWGYKFRVHQISLIRMAHGRYHSALS